MLICKITMDLLKPVFRKRGQRGRSLIRSRKRKLKFQMIMNFMKKIVKLKVVKTFQTSVSLTLTSLLTVEATSYLNFQLQI